jgi:hypothetical protein
MRDLLEIVLEHFYHPLMGGSNSIKKVIPAVLEESELLREKYSKAIYSKGRKIPSLNFSEMTWIELNEKGRVKDPYKKLPPVFQDILRIYLVTTHQCFTMIQLTMVVPR